MSRKNLPKAVTRTAEDMREGAPAEPLARLEAVAVRLRRIDASNSANSPAQPNPDEPGLGGGRRAGEVEAARRHALAARLIVERHATYAALGGFIPVPLVDFSAVAAIILRMVKVLSDHYGVPFQRDRARAIVIALMAGAAPAGLGAVTTSTLSFFVPGGLFVGLAVSSVTATACTRTIGRIFVEHFESGSTLADFPVFKKR